jgi:hypothetical protein
MRLGRITGSGKMDVFSVPGSDVGELPVLEIF